MDDSEGSFIKLMAVKLGEDEKLLKKNLDKAEKRLHDMDVRTTNNISSSESHKQANNMIFGKPIELLNAVPSLITLRNSVYPVTIPEIVHDIGRKLLEFECVTGLFRIPPHAKRLELAVESIDSGAFLHDVPNFYGHDSCGLLKQWARQLPSPMLPDFVTVYFLRIFDKVALGGLRKEEAGEILMFLMDFIPRRHKETIAYISSVLWKIAQNHAKNGMCARNLAICCPTLFIGAFAQRGLNGRQFQSLMYLMEFLITNPHMFLLPSTVAAVVEDKNDLRRLTLKRSGTHPEFDFPPPLPSLHPVMDGAALYTFARNNSKKRRRYTTQSRIQPFRGLGKVAVGLKNRIGRLNIPSCLRPHSDEYEPVAAGLKGTFTTGASEPSVLPISLLASEFADLDVTALVTPPRDQFRTKRRSSTRASFISRRSCEDVDMLGNQNLNSGLSPLHLDFEDVFEFLTPSKSASWERNKPHSGSPGGRMSDFHGRSEAEVQVDLCERLHSLIFAKRFDNCRMDLTFWRKLAPKLLLQDDPFFQIRTNAFFVAFPFLALSELIFLSAQIPGFSKESDCIRCRVVIRDLPCSFFPIHDQFRRLIHFMDPSEKSFPWLTSKIWNQLPLGPADCLDLSSFRSSLGNVKWTDVPAVKQILLKSCAASWSYD